MRYAIFTDVHANLEALETVLAKIDELAQQESIDQIWFLGDLVGYGPDPNECISKLRERTDVMIAGNHDWAAVGKIDLEDFSSVARISAEWTARQLTEDHRLFLANLPERLEIGECTLVHGSPYGPLWEYLTSEVLAERSFKHFSSRYCFVGHTHVPIIFQQPDTVVQTPTVPLMNDEQSEGISTSPQDTLEDLDNDEETQEMVAVRPAVHTTKSATHTESAHTEHDPSATAVTETTQPEYDDEGEGVDALSALPTPSAEEKSNEKKKQKKTPAEDIEIVTAKERDSHDENSEDEVSPTVEIIDARDMQHDASVNGSTNRDEEAEEDGTTPEETIVSAEDRLNGEIEELLALLGLSQSMVQVTNEMLVPPEGDWQAPEGYRAIVNPGGVGQPRDGDPRAGFVIYDTERGFTFYRIPYNFEKTQEKIIQAGLPPYLAARLSHGR